MSTPLPSDEQAGRAELDRDIRKTVAISVLRRLSNITSELEREDRRGRRIVVIALIFLLVVVIGAGVAVYFAGERYKSRSPAAANPGPLAVAEAGRAEA